MPGSFGIANPLSMGAGPAPAGVSPMATGAGLRPPPAPRAPGMSPFAGPRPQRPRATQPGARPRPVTGTTTTPGAPPGAPPGAWPPARLSLPTNVQPTTLGQAAFGAGAGTTQNAMGANSQLATGGAQSAAPGALGGLGGATGYSPNLAALLGMLYGGGVQQAM